MNKIAVRIRNLFLLETAKNYSGKFSYRLGLLPAVNFFQTIRFIHRDSNLGNINRGISRSTNIQEFQSEADSILIKSFTRELDRTIQENQINTSVNIKGTFDKNHNIEGMVTATTTTTTASKATTDILTPAPLSTPLLSPGYNAFDHPQIKSTLSQLAHIAPRFALKSGDVSVLSSPAQFYSLLKEKIASAKDRIFLATLYIGKQEHEFISCLDKALDSNQDLQLYILTDALRGTRESPNPCTASLLAPLVSKYGSNRVHLRMYHTPNLYGIRKQYIPQRFNEGWGLQHMKLYGFDDEIILSGANLSLDYFTNRQDRYVLFKSKSLTQYFFGIHQAVSSLSYKVVPLNNQENPAGFKLEWPNNPSIIPEPVEDPATFIQKATETLFPLLRPEMVSDKSSASASSTIFSSTETTSSESDESHITYVYPISQFSQLLLPDTSTELTVLSRVLSMLGTDKFNWTLTAGYFNIHPLFSEKLLKTSPQRADVITAAPQANGFFRSPGVSGHLPGAYSFLARNFLHNIITSGKGDRIRLHEWAKGIVNVADGWSYHAKGLWIGCPDQLNPCMTVIGSSNYTRRAYSHDLESNVLLVTSDPILQQQFGDEIANLKMHCREMSLEDYDKEDRRPDWKQKLFVRFMGDKM